MRLACVILNYNDSGSVKELHGLIRDYSSIDNIVIVDNLSTDGSYDSLKPLEDGHTYVIRSDKNGGYGYGNNVGIRYAKERLGATHALIANPDVEFSNDAIKTLRGAFEASERGDGKLAVAAPIVWESGTARDWKLPSAKRLVLERSKIYKRLCRPKRFYEPEYFRDKEQCQVDVVLGAMLMIDIAKMQEMGLYDEDIFLFEEENVLGFQCKKYGYMTLVFPKHEYLHKKSVSVNKNIRSRINREKIVNQSKLTALKKYYGVEPLGICAAGLFYKWCLLEIRMYELLKKH